MAAEPQPTARRWQSVNPTDYANEYRRAIGKIAEMMETKRDLESPFHAAAWPLAQFFMILDENVPTIETPPAVVGRTMSKWYWFIERELLAKFVRSHLDRETRTDKTPEENLAMLTYKVPGEPGEPNAAVINDLRVHSEDRQTFFGIVSQNRGMVSSAAYDLVYDFLNLKTKIPSSATPISYARGDILAMLWHALAKAHSMEIVVSPYYTQRTTRYWGIMKPVENAMRIPEAAMDALAGKLLTQAVVCEGCTPCFAVTMQQCWLNAQQGRGLFLGPRRNEDLGKYVAEFNLLRQLQNANAMVGPQILSPWINASSSQLLGLKSDAALGCIIREHAGDSIADFLRRKDLPMYGIVRSLLYQAAHALYYAYERLGFVHGHVDVSNTRVKYLPDYADRDWLFRTPQGWIKIPREDHCGMLLKFTDFGDSVIGKPGFGTEAYASVGYGMLEDFFGGLKRSAEIIYDLGMFCWMVTCCLDGDMVSRMIGERTLFRLSSYGLANYASLSIDELYDEYAGVLDADLWPLERTPPIEKPAEQDIQRYLDGLPDSRIFGIYVLAKQCATEISLEEMENPQLHAEMRRIAKDADKMLKYLEATPVFAAEDVANFSRFVDENLKHSRLTEEKQKYLCERLVLKTDTSLPLISALKKAGTCTMENLGTAWGEVRAFVNSPDRDTRVAARAMLHEFAMALYVCRKIPNKKSIDQTGKDESKAYVSAHAEWKTKLISISELTDRQVDELGQKYVNKLRTLRNLPEEYRATLAPFKTYPKELRRGRMRFLKAKYEISKSTIQIPREKMMVYIRKVFALPERDAELLKLRISADAKKTAAAEARDVEKRQITTEGTASDDARRARAFAEADAKQYLCDSIYKCFTALANADVERLFQLMETATKSEKIKSILFGDIKKSSESQKMRALRGEYVDEIKKVAWEFAKENLKEVDPVRLETARNKLGDEIAVTLDAIKKSAQSRTVAIGSTVYPKQPLFLRAMASTAISEQLHRDAIVDVLSRKYYARHTAFRGKTVAIQKPTATAPMMKDVPRFTKLGTAKIFEEMAKESRTRKPREAEKEIDVRTTMRDFVQVKELKDEHLFKEYKLRDISSNAAYLASGCVVMSTRATPEVPLPASLKDFVYELGEKEKLCALCGRKRPPNWPMYNAAIVRPDLFVEAPSPGDPTKKTKMIACHRICKMILEGKIDVASPLGIATTQFPYEIPVIPKPVPVIGAAPAICDGADAIFEASEVLARMPTKMFVVLLRDFAFADRVRDMARMLLAFDEEYLHAPAAIDTSTLAILDAFVERKILQILANDTDVCADAVFRAACIRIRRMTENRELEDLEKIYEDLRNHVINYVDGPNLLMQLLANPRMTDIVSQALLISRRTKMVVHDRGQPTEEVLKSAHPLVDKLRSEIREWYLTDPENTTEKFIKPLARLIALPDPKRVLYEVLKPKFDYANNPDAFAEDQKPDRAEYLRYGIAMTLACNVDTATLSVLREDLDLGKNVGAVAGSTTVAELNDPPGLLQKIKEALAAPDIGAECLDLAIAASLVCIKFGSRVGDPNVSGIGEGHMILYLGCMMPSKKLEELEVAARDTADIRRFLTLIENITQNDAYSQIVTSDVERYLTEQSRLVTQPMLEFARIIAGQAGVSPAQMQRYAPAKCEEWLANLAGTRCIPHTLSAIHSSDAIMDSVQKFFASDPNKERRYEMDTNAYVFTGRMPTSTWQFLGNLERSIFRRIMERASAISDELVRPATPPPSPIQPPIYPSPGPEPASPPTEIEEPPQQIILIPEEPQTEGEAERRGPIPVTLRRIWLRSQERRQKKPEIFDAKAEKARRAEELRKYVVKTPGGMALRNTQRRQEIRETPGRKTTTVLVLRSPAAAAAAAPAPPPKERKKKERTKKSAGAPSSKKSKK